MISIILRYGFFPAVFVGGNVLGLSMAAAGTPLWQRIAVIVAAILLVLWAERVLPYERRWNRDHGDTWRDVLHAGINTTLNNVGIWLLPLFASLGLFSAYWPGDWPFWLQVVFAILVLDAGVTLAHYASHRLEVLWRFHAVHHSVERMYGFNGLMKHPVHQSIETVAGMTPLLLLGIPSDVATAVVFAVVIQLLLQHSNVDYRTGPFKYLLASAEVHRFHHRKGAGLGDVNFGLFTMLWDHMLGTYYCAAERVSSNALGIGDRPGYPRAYVAQLIEPFRQRPITDDVYGTEQ
jgi:sterol desaturase/sphingolipid hydroxylase (fatty acid hydroxylase superfamily)